MTGGIEIHGYAEAVRLMSQLTDQMQRTLVRQALRRSAQPIVATARARAPHRTGRLKRSIGIVSLRRDRVLKFTGREGGTVYTPTARGMKPNPFLRKAFDLSSDVTVANFGRELETVIARFVNRNFRKL